MPGIQELLVIAVVALLVFGPDRLPEFARRAAQVVVKVRTEAERNIAAFRSAADLDGLEEDLRGIRDELSPRASTTARRGGRRVVPQRVSRAPDAAPPTDPDAT